MKRLFFILLSLTALLTACSEIMSVEEAQEHINSEIKSIEQEGNLAALKTNYSANDFENVNTATFISGEWYMLTDTNIENARYLHVVYLENDSASKEFFKYFEKQEYEYVCNLGTMVIAASGKEATDIAEDVCN